MRILHISVTALVVAVVMSAHKVSTLEVSDNDEDQGSVYFTIEGLELNDRMKRDTNKWNNRGNKWGRKKAGKDLTELDLSISMANGEKVNMKLGKVKVMTSNVKTYKANNEGKLEEIVREPNSVVTFAEATKGVNMREWVQMRGQYSVFQDASNNTESMFLLACDEVECKTCAAIYHGTEVFTLEPTSTEPFLNKGKSSIGKGKQIMNDERTLGIAKDGSSLGIPVSTRKRRDLVLDRKMTESLLKRKRRQLNNVNNVVELVIIADYSEYQYWYDRAGNDSVGAEMAMELYFILLTNMMDLRFENLYEQTNDMDINFMINAIIFSESEAASLWTQANIVESGGMTLVDADQALDDLTIWGWLNRADLPPHDHVMAVTKGNLATEKTGAWSGDVIGVTWTGGMCSPGFSISMIEDPGIGLIDYAAAHEIGHSLNARHDGAAGCSDDDFFIMASSGGSPVEGLSSTGREGHSFQFSTCAVNAIHDYVSGLGASNCMQSSTYNQTVYDNYKTFLSPGAFMPVDTQCELQYGDGSRRCYALDSTICSDGAWCWNPADPGFCYTLYVREGTVCGDKMRCHKGECMNSTVSITTCPPSSSDIDTGDALIVVPQGVTAIPDQVTTTATPYQSTAQTLLANSQAFSQDVRDSSNDLFC